jgi:hypothetical protein
MLASFPASMLNQNTPDLGILNRLKLDPSRSRPLRQLSTTFCVAYFASSRFTGQAMTGVAIKRFFEITISSLEIGGLVTRRSRVLPIAWHGHTGSIQRRRLAVAELGVWSYRPDRYSVQFKSFRLATPNP